MWPFKPRYLKTPYGVIQIEHIKEFSAHVFNVKDSDVRQYGWIIYHFYNGEYSGAMDEIRPGNQKNIQNAILTVRNSIGSTREIPIWEMLKQESYYPAEPRWHEIADALRNRTLRKSQLEWICPTMGIWKFNGRQHSVEDGLQAALRAESFFTKNRLFLASASARYYLRSNRLKDEDHFVRILDHFSLKEKINTKGADRETMLKRAFDKAASFETKEARGTEQYDLLGCLIYNLSVNWAMEVGYTKAALEKFFDEATADLRQQLRNRDAIPESIKAKVKGDKELHEAKKMTDTIAPLDLEATREAKEAKAMADKEFQDAVKAYKDELSKSLGHLAEKGVEDNLRLLEDRAVDMAIQRDYPYPFFHDDDDPFPDPNGSYQRYRSAMLRRSPELIQHCSPKLPHQ